MVGVLSSFGDSRITLLGGVQTKSRICIRLFVVMRFKRLHPGAQKGSTANYWSLLEPHYKQNLYTNPKRTAKLYRLLN